MEITSTKKFSGTPFTIGCSPMDNGPGKWKSTKVSVYWGEDLIGEYLRNYSSFAEVTFYPFRQDNQWYALYSAEYTALRVMRLHENTIEDWCGQAPSSLGFCPTEVLVPKYNRLSYDFNNNGTIEKNEYFTVDVDYEKESEFINETKDVDYQDTTYCEFGFMSGCVWGDDTSWKIRYIDLSKISERQISITEKFGYWEMPDGLKLKQCIDMSGWEPDLQWIRLTKAESINLVTDKRV
jgi:hypothetical protein